MGYLKHKYGRTFVKILKSNSKEKKRPLIFIHGGPGGDHNYFLNLKSLARDRDLYFYDQVGGGQSSKLDKKFWEISTFIREVEMIIKNYDLQEYDLFSVSWGCVIALELSLKNPPGLNKIIIQSPLVDSKDWQKDAEILIKGLNPSDQKIIRYCHEINATDCKVYKNSLMKYYEKHVLRNKKILYSKKKRSSKGQDIYQFMWGSSEFNSTGSLKSYSFKNKLNRLKQRFLFISGYYDEARPETVREYAKKVKNSDFAIVKNASHCISLENPKALLKLVSRFLNDE